MGKLFMVAILVGFGYGAHKGLFSSAVSDMRAAAGMTLESERPAPEQEAAHEPAPAYPPPVSMAPAASALADQCALARSNVREMQSWMSQGGTVVEVNANKKLSQNETFAALALNRQFIEDNCRR